MKRLLGLRRPGPPTLYDDKWFWRPYPGTEPIGEDFKMTITAVGFLRSVVVRRTGSDMPLWSAMFSALECDYEPELVTEEIEQATQH